MPKKDPEWWCIRAPDGASTVFDSVEAVAYYLDKLPDPRQYQVFTAANDRRDVWTKNVATGAWRSRISPWFKNGMVRNIGPIIVDGTTKRRLIVNTFSITKKCDARNKWYVCFRTGSGKRPKFTIDITQAHHPNYDLGSYERMLGCSLEKLNAIYMAWEIWSQAKRSESFESIYKDL